MKINFKEILEEASKDVKQKLDSKDMEDVVDVPAGSEKEDKEKEKESDSEEDKSKKKSNPFKKDETDDEKKKEMGEDVEQDETEIVFSYPSGDGATLTMGEGLRILVEPRSGKSAAIVIKPQDVRILKKWLQDNT